MIFYRKTPQEIVSKRIKEFIGKVDADMDAAHIPLQELPEGQLLPPDASAFPLEYLQKQFSSDEGLMMHLICRNREQADIEKATEEVVKIIEGRRFTVSEALLFLKQVEAQVLATPVNR